MKPVQRVVEEAIDKAVDAAAEMRIQAKVAEAVRERRVEELMVKVEALVASGHLGAGARGPARTLAALRPDAFEAFLKNGPAAIAALRRGRS